MEPFVKRFNLSDQSVLEIGSGRGYLQDVVAKVHRAGHLSQLLRVFTTRNLFSDRQRQCPFQIIVLTVIWSIWVFEHVPNPEQAFYEARRVTRDNGVLFFYPHGIVRPGQPTVTKSDPMPILAWRENSSKRAFHCVFPCLLELRPLCRFELVRTLVAASGPTRLRYRRLTPNYDQYWVPDSDAVNSIDSHEAMLWFLSRGDECLNCEEASVFLPIRSTPLIIRVHKKAG